MDSGIRKHLDLAKNAELRQAKDYLHKAYQQIRSASGKQIAPDGPEAFRHDLPVLCAEMAYQFGESEIACDCLSIYFQRTPSSDQFLGRAYICQAQLNAPCTADDVDQFNKAVSYLLKAIEFSKGKPRYHFLVLNASLIYWQICRPLLKRRHRRHLVSSLRFICEALDETNDADLEWRAELKIALIESLLDAEKKAEASKVTMTTADFVQNHAPGLTKKMFALAVMHELDAEGIKKMMKKSPELSFYRRICVLQRMLEKKDSPDDGMVDEMNRLVEDLSSGDIISPTSPNKSNSVADERPYLLLELGRVAMEFNQPDIGMRCINAIKRISNNAKDAGCFSCEVEFLNLSLMAVGQLASGHSESYQKAAVDVRLDVIRQCTETLLHAIRLSNADVIQVGCVTQWNLCLPLLQTNLRKHVRRPLTVVAQALESIQSLLFVLRCLIHTELAKCEEDEDQMAVAIDHVQKALRLDESHVYREGLEVYLHRLKMCTQLYEQPERDEDIAAMIIEQARNTNSGTRLMKSSLLVKAGQALAPEEFLQVLQSEADDRDISSIKDVEIRVKMLAEKVRRYDACVQKADGHLQRIGNKNDKERALLWADLTKVARKQEVWDVCRVAARFCLLYDDDDHWPSKDDTKFPKTMDRVEKEAAAVDSVLHGSVNEDIATPLSTDRGTDKEEENISLYERKLIRLMAEVRFINGEAVIHQLRMEGVELFDLPPAPVDTRKRPKGVPRTKAEDDPNWITYTDWLRALSRCALLHFLRGAAIGAKLSEPWLVCNAAAYVWNYCNHLMLQHRNQELVPAFQAILDLLKKTGYAGETCLVVRICNALALGLVQPWMMTLATPGKKDAKRRSSSPLEKSLRKGKTNPLSKQKPTAGLNTSLDAIGHLQAALEVCEYGLAITNGGNRGDSVPIGVRFPLLRTWVRVKHWLQSAVGKTLGVSDEASNSGQDAMTRAIVAVELLCNEKRSDFKDPGMSSVPQVVELVEAVGGWTDPLVELEIWTSLGQSALLANDHTSTERCFQKSRDLEPTFDARRPDSHAYIVSQELLGYMNATYGQSLLQTSSGKNNVLRRALQQFVQSARHGRNAKNSEIVLSAARHFWNRCQPLIEDATQRELLRDPLSLLLQCVAETVDKNKYKISDDAEKDSEADVGDDVAASGDGGATPHHGVGAESKCSEVRLVMDEELSIRASLYAMLFQSYADKGDWQGALKATELAIKNLPRTNHRMVIYKNLVLIKARLNLDISITMNRFKDQSEGFIADIWRQVALSSNQQQQQMEAYQNAIATLVSSGSDWQKVDYLLEFSQWLYCNQFPVEDALNQLQWAVDILLNRKPDVDQLAATTSEAVERKVKKKGSRTSPSPSGKGDRQKPRKSEQKLNGHGRSTEQQRNRSEQNQNDQNQPESGLLDPSGQDQKDQTKIDHVDRAADETEMDASKFIPVKVEAEIGVLSRNPVLALKDISDVRQLEGLCRSFTLLARISGRNSTSYSDHCLMAYAMVMQMWKVSIGSIGSVMKEIAKLPVPEEATRQKGSPKRKKEAEESVKKKRKDPDEAKEKPEQRLPFDALPSNLEEWSTYEVPEEVQQTFKHPLMASSSGISSQTIQKPTLTIWYLDELVTMLRDLEFPHLALPVVVMEGTVASSVIPCHSLSTLIHLQAMELCQEMNLSNGVLFHHRRVEFRLNEDDQSKGSEEITLWRNKQSKLVDERGDRQKKEGEMNAQDKETRRQKAEEVGESVAHVFPINDSVCLRDVWLKTAEIMIRNCIFRPALQLLNEARNMALAFGDKQTVGRALLQMGKLSLAEAQYQQAYQLSKEAEDVFCGDEKFWYETTILKSDSILKDQEKINAKEKYSRAREVLEKTIEVFIELEKLRPNQAAIIAYFLLKLRTKMAAIDVDVAMATHTDIEQTVLIRNLLTVDETLEMVSVQFQQLGCHRDAANVMKDQALILRRLAKEENDREMKHGYYIQAAEILREAVLIMDSCYEKVQAVSPLYDFATVSLPVQRECIQMKLAYIDVLLEMFQIHVMEEVTEETQIHRQDSVIRTLNDIVRETPTYTRMGKQWHTMTRTVADDIMSQLTSAHGLSGNIFDLKASALCMMGRCLRLQSSLTTVDPPTQWNVSAVVQEEEEEEEEEAEKRSSVQLMSREDLRGRSEGASGFATPPTSEKGLKQYARNSPIITKYFDNFNASTHYLYQATECLQQAMNLSIDKGFRSTLGTAALELVECIGQFDPGLSTLYLALYQSCQSSEYLHGLLRQALMDPSLSQQAALFHQYDSLLSNNIISNAASGPTYKAVVDTLNTTSEAWKRLSILPQHLDLGKEFPPNFLFVILQHSPDRSKMYGAILDTSKQLQSVAGKLLKPGSNPTQAVPISKARIIRTDTSAKCLDYLTNQWKSFKKDVKQSLLRQEFQRVVQTQQQKFLSKVEDPFSSLRQDILDDEEDKSVEYELQRRFFWLLAETESYLRPITAELENYLRLSKTPPTGGRRQSAKPGADDTAPNYVILLADQHLLELPLEALQAFRSDVIDAVCRDVSLQMFHHRYHGDDSDGDVESPKKEKPSTKSSSKALKGSASKTGKSGVVDRPLPPGCQAIDANSFKYVVDPHADCWEGEEKKPLTVFNSILQEYSSLTARWTGISGDSQVPSAGQYEEFLLNGGSFIFYGMERFLAYLPPHKAAALSLSESELLLLMDQSQTNSSYGRQAKQDFIKRDAALRLEEPVSTAMLLSLAGVRCCLLNQWHCSVHENAVKFQILLRDLAGRGKSTGEAIRRLIDLRHREKEDEAEGRKIREEEEAQKATKEMKRRNSKESGTSTKKAKGKSGKTDQTTQKTKSSDDEDTKDEDIRRSQVSVATAHEELLSVTRSSCAMVCYGLPNLVITQLGKR